MWGSVRKSSSNFLKYSEQILLPKRTTFVFKRINEDSLVTNEPAPPQKLKQKHFIYEVEDTDVKKSSMIDLVLLKDVPGIGMTGEKITINSYIAYRDLLMPKLATYPGSQEAKIVERPAADKQYSSMYSKIIEQYLSDKALAIIIHAENKWTLEPVHIKVALRNKGIFVNDDCIKLPEQKLTGPNLELENRDFIVRLIMNKSEEFPVRCRLYHNKLSKLSDKEKYFLNTVSSPLFKDEREEIKKLLKSEEEILKLEKIKSVKPKKHKMPKTHKFEKKRMY